MIKNIVVISDTHSGCKFALCPPKVKLDDGGEYIASKYQLELWEKWKQFWNVEVPKLTKNETFVVVHNGDAIDGIHHDSVTQVSHNIVDQINIAEEVMQIPLRNPKCKGYYHIRGTEAHVGKSGQYEEQLAKRLNAIPSEDGQYARWEMYLRFGKNKDHLIHFTHHVGTTNSSAYESTAVYKEFIEAYTEAGRFGDVPPSVICRSHRHRDFIIPISVENGLAYSVVTPAWQLKTPFVYRGMLGRASTPHIGGIIIRENQDGFLYIQSKVWRFTRTKEEIL